MKMLQHVTDRLSSADNAGVTATKNSSLPSDVRNTEVKSEENITGQPFNFSGCNNINSASSTTDSLMTNLSMPLAVPLSGLATIPLALCAMNGAGNIASNAVQTAGGLMTQPGLVLLNVAGNTTGLSKLLTCQNQLQQQILQQVPVSTENCPSLPITSAQETPLIQQTQAAVSSVLGSVTQVPMQPSVLPQQPPTAYMLVPIHHLQTSQSVVQPQQLAVSASQAQTSAQSAVASVQNTSLASVNAVGETNESQYNDAQTTAAATAHLQAIKAANPISSLLLPQTVTTVPTSTPFNVTSSTSIPVSNPVNDPHISSSVPVQEMTCVARTSIHENQNFDESITSRSISELNQIQVNQANSASSKSSCSIQAISAKVVHSSVSKSKASIPSSFVLSSKSSAAAEGLPKVPEKRKKGPAPKLDGSELCSICSDKASGYHYGVLSCEGCKGFFRRCIIKSSQYQCKETGQCRMDSYTRRRCQACRLKKCRGAGMKDENVFSEVNSGNKPKKVKKDPAAEKTYLVNPELALSPTLSSHQLNMVEMLQANENRYQWPSPEDVDRLTPWNDSLRSRSARFNHFTELTILIVQLVVEFTKQLPGFLDVSREDQIILLKACTIEVMLLRAAKQYDKKNQAINVLNGKYYDRSSFYKAGMQVEFVDPIFDFCDSMAKLDLDEAEYALLVAINTFSSDRPNLKDLKKIEAIQDQYVELLRVYLKIHHPNDPLMFPRTLMKLVELRTLNNHHSEQMFALKVQDKQLPPLLAEIWDM